MISTFPGKEGDLRISLANRGAEEKAGAVSIQMIMTGILAWARTF